MDSTIKTCIEIFGVAAALVYVFLEIRQRRSMWIVGMISSAVYVYVFFAAKFYADAALSAYYVAASFYGMWCWRGSGAKSETAGDNKTHMLPVSRATLRQGVVCAGAAAVLWGALRAVLVLWTDSPVPTGDSFTTALSIVGTIMLARKILEVWFVWVAVNAVSASLYLYKGLYPTAALYIIYTMLSFYGFWQWKKDMNRTTRATAGPSAKARPPTHALEISLEKER